MKDHHNLLSARHRWVRVLGAVFSVLFVGAATSQAARRYDKQEVKVQAAAKSHTKVDAKSAMAPESAPGLRADEFKSAVRERVGALTDAQISTLKRLIRATADDDPEKPDFYFRLAEHYREKKLEYMFKGGALDERIYLAPAPKKKKLKDLQARYRKAEKQWMIGAIKLYLKVATTKEYAQYKRMDEVLFNLADMLNQAKRRDRARLFFGELIRNYPASKYIPDAYLSFAEHYFEDNRVEEALRRYQQVAKYKNSPLYGYAIYKQAWCWINLKDPARALKLFITVIRDGKKWAGSEKSRIVLIKEAKKDMVKAYAYVGSPNKAWPFFQRIGGDYAMKMLERLAYVYYDQGKFDDSIQIFKQLMALNPRSKKICSWQYSIVRATLSGQPKNQQVVEVRRLSSVYDALKRRKDMRKNAVAECKDNAAGVLRELATTWHNEAQKTHNKDTYALAEYLYREYIDAFPNEPDAYMMAFYYAELLFKLQRWKQAAEAYTHVVKMKANGKHLQEAAYAAVISWKNALDVQEEVKDTETAKPGEEYKPRPIADNYKKMIDAFDTYLKYVPKAAKERPTIMYRKARIYYEHNQFDRAIEMFGRVVNDHPDHELAPYSANLMLDCLNIQKRYDDLEKWLDKLWNSKLGKHPEVANVIGGLRGQIKRKQLELAQEKGRYRECGFGYARLASEYPDDDKWPELAYNAALCFEAAKLIGQAIEIRTRLINVAPKNPLAQKAMYMIGQNYHALAWYSRAAEWYERFAKAFPGEDNAPEALRNAIVFRLGRAEYDLAEQDIKFFAKTYGSRPKYAEQTAQVVFSLGSVYEQQDDLDAIISYYMKYLRKWGKYGGIDRQIVANVKIATAYWRKSCPIKGVDGACIKIERVRSKRTVSRRRRGKKRNAIEVRKQCGPETKSRITVVERERSPLRKAIRHFTVAIKMQNRGKIAATKQQKEGDVARRLRDMQYAVAQARFYQAESQFEKMLTIEFPKDLNFSERDKRRLKKSIKEFTRYLEKKGKMLERARNMYQKAIKERVPHWAIASAARIGQLFQNFADALYTAPVPKPSIPPAFRRSKEAKEEFVMAFTDAYCQKLEDKAMPLESKAVEGLAACLQRSTDLSWYNEWSELCEAELNQIRPAEYPIASEIRAKPGYLSLEAVSSQFVDQVD